MKQIYIYLYYMYKFREQRLFHSFFFGFQSQSQRNSRLLSHLCRVLEATIRFESV